MKVDQSVAHQLARALGVIVLTDTTNKWLAENDPRALDQANAALRAYGRDTGLWPVNSRATPQSCWGRKTESPFAK